MILDIAGKWEFKDIFVTIFKRNLDLTEELLFGLLRDYEIQVYPENYYDIYHPRANYGWKATSLKYFCKVDTTTIFLPEPESLIGQKDIQKLDDDEKDINCTREELTREIEKLRLDISRIERLVRGDI